MSAYSHLTQFIKEKALNLGFSRVGIARASRLEPEGNRLRSWLERGYHGTMDWMTSRMKERQNIRHFFPEAKSVVSLAMNYYHGTAQGELQVSNYAWGHDYHHVVKGRLLQLMTFIREVRPEVNGLACVDTSPVMEKAWAQRAGLGWIGKHTNLVTRDYGSWLFLGELILDCELQYDLPFQDDFCGSCTACLDACPTNAIAEEYILNANRCISYLTIEHRGDLPEEFAHQLRGWIFGCDMCQQVCPWNIKFSQESSEPSFAPRREIVQWSADDWMRVDEDDYRRLFRKSAVKRTKFRGLKRNIAACASPHR